jgi:hypothetical protein
LFYIVGQTLKGLTLTKKYSRRILGRREYNDSLDFLVGQTLKSLTFTKNYRHPEYLDKQLENTVLN